MVEIYNVKVLVCDHVFALFILYIYKYVSQKLYKEIIIVIICYWETLNQKKIY